MSKDYDPQTKAAALAAIVTGESLSSVSKRLGISRTTLKRWRDGEHLPAPSMTGHQKRQELGEQLFGYLQESITTLEFLVKFTRNEKWLTRQSASDVAVLYGVLTDKSVRLLAALQSPATDSTGDVD